MELEFDGDGTVDVITVKADRIDAAGVVAFKDGFRAAISKGDGTVVLNMGGVDFIDSSGLGAIVAAQKLMGEGRSLELAALQGAVAKVMQLTRMDSVFCIHDNLAAAQAAHPSSAV